MDWHYGPFAPPLVLSGLVAIVLAIAVWRRQRASGSAAFALMMGAMAIWSFAAVAELGATDLEDKVFWANVEFLGIAGAPFLWFIFVRQYTSLGARPTRPWILVFALIPLLTNVLAWTNPWHGLLRRDVYLDTAGAWSIAIKAFGPWFVVHICYSYGLLFASALYLLRWLPREFRTYRAQWIAMLVGLALPWAGSIVYVVIPRHLLRLDFTPMSITASGLALGYALYRYGLLDIVPAARNQIVEQMHDGILVVDSDDRVVDINQSAERLTGWPGARALGRPLREVVYRGMTLLERHSEEESNAEELLRETEEGRRFFDLRRAALRSRRGLLLGWVVTLRDITRRRQAEEERERLIGELRSALAEVRTLSGLLPICASCKKIRDDDGYWRQLEVYLSDHSDAEFTHGICPECLARLYAELPSEAPVDDRGE